MFMRLAARKSHGFSLIELMVGLAVGLILLTAMMALVVSVLRANADAVASAKLNQEGRAIGDIMHRELKRARYSGLYLDFVGAGASPANPFGNITGADASLPLVNDDCIKFSYDADDDGALDANEVKSFFLDNGALYFSQASTYAGALCSSSTGALRLSSGDVIVRALTFRQRPDDAATVAVDEENKNEILVAYELELTRSAGDDTGVTRDFGQVIQLRNPILE
jgi:prepilin-type N-terminal cleavage/methylation domain-containing protein